MRMPHFTSAFVLLSFFLSITGSAALAQTHQRDVASNQDTERAIETYQQGDTTKAINHLQVIVEKRPDDADAWCYLGLAFHSQGLIRNSVPAFEQCVRLRPESADAHAKLAYAWIFVDQPKKALSSARRALELGDQTPEAHYAIAEVSLRAQDHLKAVEESETALRINPNFSDAMITKSLAQYHLKQYSEAAASLEQFLATNPDDMDAESWRGQLDELRQLVSQAANPTPPIFTAKEVTQKPQILSKPEPQYSTAARKAGVTGSVVLRAVLSAEGDVKHIVITKARGYGLTTRSVEAARQIRFTPAMKDATPVSIYIQLEYNFNLY
jgi:TonB family protein